LFFRRGAADLFAIFHEPAAAIPGEPFVFCHPFAEEKLWTHRVFVLFARRLAAAGHPVLRFDYMGNGDSSGTFSDSTVSSMVADTCSAVEETRRLTGATIVNLLGLRFGATVAALAAEELPVHRLVLWAPIVDGNRYMQDLLRVNVTTQATVYSEVRHDRTALVEMMRQGQTVNVDGYEMGYPMFSEASSVQLARRTGECSADCLIVQIDRAPGRTAPDLAELSSRWPTATVRFVQEEPFWKEIPVSYQREASNLFASTMDWLAPQ
jgi:exosortase A-associated hydrolase 2